MSQSILAVICRGQYELHDHRVFPWIVTWIRRSEGNTLFLDIASFVSVLKSLPFRVVHVVRSQQFPVFPCSPEPTPTLSEPDDDAKPLLIVRKEWVSSGPKFRGRGRSNQSKPRSLMSGSRSETGTHLQRRHPPPRHPHRPPPTHPTASPSRVPAIRTVEILTRFFGIARNPGTRRKRPRFVDS